MNKFALEIWDDEGKTTTFYTIRKSNSVESEVDDFFTKYENNQEYKDEFDTLTSFIFEVIGDRRGARSQFFRFEKAAHALPPPGRVNQFIFFDFTLRLYCLRVTDEIVILMNGGIKSAPTAQNSPLLKQQFKEANAFVREIDNAIKSRELRISQCGRYLLTDGDLSSLELYY